MECHIKNANQDRVLSAINTLQKDRYSHVCSCTGCISDIAAIALNYLPPHYFANGAKETEKEAGSPWVMVETAVVEAIERVHEHPSVLCSKRHIALERTSHHNNVADFTGLRPDQAPKGGLSSSSIHEDQSLA
jgi:late competence development protein ComFB